MTGKQKFLFIALLAFVATILGRLFLNSPITHISFAAEGVIRDVFGTWNITNSLISAWVAMAILIGLAFLATRKMRMAPRGFQNFGEAIIAWLLGLVENVAGKRWGRTFFPLVATIFLFIIVANWSALIPVFGTIGNIETADEFVEHQMEDVVGDLNEGLPAGQEPYPDHFDAAHPPPPEVARAFLLEVGDDGLTIFNGESGFRFIPLGFGKAKELTVAEYWDVETWEPRQGVVQSGDTEVNLEGKTVGILVPYLRSMNTDIISPLAIALIAMFMVHYWGFKANGFFSYASRYINLKGGPIGFFVGILELISEVSRVISFTFRLLGNMFAGEVLIFSFVFLLPVMAGILVMPFILETFVGFIQALIFAALTLLFAALAVESHEGEHGAEGHTGH